MDGPFPRIEAGPEQKKQAAGMNQRGGGRAYFGALPLRLSEDPRLILDLLDW